MNESEGRSCFVLMPFRLRESDLARYGDENHWNEVFVGLIRPAVEAAGFGCVRDDQDVGSRLIIPNILRRIEAADIVLCDLSSHNANVLLELGWALRADRRYVLIKDDLTEFSFDLNQQYTFEYSHRLQPITLDAEVKQLSEVLRETMKDASRRYSMVARVGVEASAIREVEKGDVDIRLLIEMKEQVRQVLRSVEGERVSVAEVHDDFPWPSLVKRASHVMQEVRDRLKAAEEDSEIPALLEEYSRERGLRGQDDIEFSVFSGGKVILYHGMEIFIGRNALQLIDGVFHDVFEYEAGAVAWEDHLARGRRRGRGKRRSVALFSTVGQGGWKVVVETHT